MARDGHDRGQNWWNETEAVMPVARKVTDEGNTTGEIVHNRNYVWDAGGGSWVKATLVGGAATPDGAIVDGVTAGIRATVFDYTNSNPLAIRLTDLNGDYVSAGGGTQYTEDVASPADPTGTAIAARRRDTLAAETTTDGDWVTPNATNKGELYVKHVDTIPVSYGSGTFVVSGPLTDAQLRATPVPVSGTFWQGTQPVSIGAVVSVDDNAGSLTVDGTFWQATQPVSGTFWQATQPVSGTVDTELTLGDMDTGAGTDNRAVVGLVLAESGGGLLVGSANPVPVSGTFWQATQPVSGTVTANAGTGPWPITDNAGTLTVDDGGGSLTVDGAFFQATQPVSIAAVVPVSDNAGSLTVDGTFWQATQPVSGTFWQATQPVSGTFFQATQPVSGTVTANAATSHGKTITYVSVNQGAAGTTVLAAASPGNKHKIVGAVLTISANGTMKFTGTGDLTGPLDLTATGGFVLPTSIMPYFVGSTNVDLSLVSTAGAVRGVISILTEA